MAPRARHVVTTLVLLDLTIALCQLSTGLLSRIINYTKKITSAAGYYAGLLCRLFSRKSGLRVIMLGLLTAPPPP